MILTIPYPPSANRLWRSVNGRAIKSAEYRDWLDEAARFLLTQPGRTPMTGPYILTLVATRPDWRRRDLGNLEKPVSDLLQHVGLVRDDCDAQSIRLTWSDAAPDPAAGVRVHLEAA